jgi:phage tail sheath protein FI
MFKIRFAFLFVLVAIYGYSMQYKMMKKNSYRMVPRSTLTSVTGFIGQSRSGPINKAVKIMSAREYTSLFGTAAHSKYLAYAVRGFFQNGGRMCYVVNIGFGRDLRSERNLPNVLQGNGYSRIITAIKVFEKIKEISIVCAPGITNPNAQKIIINHCEKMGNRFAILDIQRDTNAGLGRLNRPPSSANAAAYFPWLKIYDAKKRKFLFVPPSGHVAGIYARVDAEKGSHKAPAGPLFPIKGINGLKYNLVQRDVNGLTLRSINPIRSFQGSGYLIWGARTLSNDPEWKYVNVRRFCLYVKENIAEHTKWAVREPNNTLLWNKLKSYASEYLLDLWKKGALLGSKPSEAFFVRCDSYTNTVDMIEAGRVQVLVGIALIKPGEFILIKIQHNTAN